MTAARERAPHFPRPGHADEQAGWAPRVPHQLPLHQGCGAVGERRLRFVPARRRPSVGARGPHDPHPLPVPRIPPDRRLDPACSEGANAERVTRGAAALASARGVAGRGRRSRGAARARASQPWASGPRAESPSRGAAPSSRRTARTGLAGLGGGAQNSRQRKRKRDTCTHIKKIGPWLPGARSPAWLISSFAMTSRPLVLRGGCDWVARGASLTLRKATNASKEREPRRDGHQRPTRPLSILCTIPGRMTGAAPLAPALWRPELDAASDAATRTAPPCREQKEGRLKALTFTR